MLQSRHWWMHSSGDLVYSLCSLLTYSLYFLIKLLCYKCFNYMSNEMIPYHIGFQFVDEMAAGPYAAGPYAARCYSVSLIDYSNCMAPGTGRAPDLMISLKPDLSNSVTEGGGGL